MNLGYNNQCDPVIRLGLEEVKCVLNVYPKELLISEIEHDDLLNYDLKNLDFIEPIWKLILGNKALLPLLWEMFPNHPNLLPAYQESPKIHFPDKFIPD
jgi:glutathionylspermidine synthase